jgi:hypothetical protein
MTATFSYSEVKSSLPVISLFISTEILHKRQCTASAHFILYSTTKDRATANVALNNRGQVLGVGCKFDKMQIYKLSIINLIF